MKKEYEPMWSKIWTGSMIAALAASVGIFAGMLQLEKKLLSDYEKGLIYVAEKEIPKGTVITEENRNLFMEPRELDIRCVPETALSTPEQATGLIAKGDIEPGVLLTEGMFETPSQITEQMQKPVIAGFKADDLYQVVGGVLRAGDRIHIYTVAEDGQAGLVWESVYVEQVFDNAGNNIDSGNRTSSAQRMNVFLDAADVEHFYTELAKGTLRVVKVCD